VAVCGTALGLQLKLQPEKDIFLFNAKDAVANWTATSDRSIGGNEPFLRVDSMLGGCGALKLLQRWVLLVLKFANWYDVAIVPRAVGL
jgi:hypothetical protein